ncbi:hypothetical protein [Streptomyces sp. V2]|uniref:hypothetical protein n=1 Tax=Streptomyces sp. V2 TaxID=1424099 RepID=UPI0019D1FCB3|nr:hypothetical protein [Streptomyces sp. V2]
MQKLVYRALLRDTHANKDLSGKAIRSGGLDWTLVYPAPLTKGPAQGTDRAARRSAARSSPPACTRRSTAPSGSATTPSAWTGRLALRRAPPRATR